MSEKGKHTPMCLARKAKGMTQEQVGNAIGTTKKTYREYELGKTKPSGEALCKLSDLFGVSTDYLLGRCPDYRTMGNAFIGEHTGLTDEAIEMLRFYSRYSLNTIQVGYADSVSFENVDWFGAARVHACVNKLLAYEYDRVFKKDPNKPKMPNLLADLFSYIFDNKQSRISAIGNNDKDYIGSIKFLCVEQQGRPIEPIFPKKMLDEVRYHEVLDDISQLKRIASDTEKQADEAGEEW